MAPKPPRPKRAQSRLKQIERIEVEELKTSSRQTPLFRFTPARPSGKDVLEIVNLSKSYGDKHVLQACRSRFAAVKKSRSLDSNGLGKSTLLKIITENVAADEGTVKRGHEVRVGYFAQDHHELLKNAKDPFPSTTCGKRALGGTSYVRGQLGRVLFSGEDVNKPVGSLSGGEAARLIFGRIIVEAERLGPRRADGSLGPRSDPRSRRRACRVRRYAHFRLSRPVVRIEVATRIIELTENGPRDFPGTYTRNISIAAETTTSTEKLSRQSKRACAPIRRMQKASVPPRCRSIRVAAGRPPRLQASRWTSLSPGRTRRRKNRINQLPVRRDKVLAEIEAAEARKAQIAALYDDPNFYMSTPNAEIERLGKRPQSSPGRSKKASRGWEALESEIAKYSA